jgi:hypothetical protein
LPEKATLLDVFRMFPETNRPLLEFHEVLLRGASPFTEAERELIAAYVSGLNGCRYCHGVHAANSAHQYQTPYRVQSGGLWSRWGCVAIGQELGSAIKIAERRPY